MNLFHPASTLRICNTGMAFASCPARHGQRSVRRMRQGLELRHWLRDKEAYSTRGSFADHALHRLDAVGAVLA